MGVVWITFLFIGVAVADTNYRLNTTIKPSNYKLTLTPYFDTNDTRAFSFDGEVIITFTTTAPTNQIKFHSHELNFTINDITLTPSVVLSSNNPLQFDTYYDFVFLHLENNLQVDTEYSLRITYTGPIRHDMYGFYRNYYMEGGVKKWMGATQMEPTHARKVFPCFDEPGLKATFDLTIDRPANYKPTLANMKIQNTETLSGNMVREVFHTTPIMPTYLLAFAVSEFEGRRNNDSSFGVYTRPEALNQSEYAFEFGEKVVKQLGDYFGIDYYSTNENLKLDHIALVDFNSGAMENWGLVTYREALLLYVPEVSMPYYKYRVSQIIAHETTHMWFGDLVTCHWWSDTWLNEGFANYFQDYITILIEPELGTENILVTGSVYAAYDADDSPDSPPISNENVNSPKEISDHFGTVTYQKAGSVIRMMHHLIGDDAFKKGLNSYLNNSKYGSGVPSNLYEGLQTGVMSANSFSSYPGANIRDVMSSWITKSGHPLLTITIDYENKQATLSQKRFYINSTHSSNETYMIPITYTTKLSPNFVNTKPAFIMEGSTYNLTLHSNLTEDSWVIFNIQETGLYRVNYDDNSWRVIANALKSEEREKIHHLNRAKIVNDLFAFFYADVVGFERVYEVLEFLKDEDDYSVWHAALRGLNKLRNTYIGTNALESIEEYALDLMENIINKLGLEPQTNDSYETLRNRQQLLEFACKLGHQVCIDKSIELFQALKQNDTQVSPSLRSIVYCNGLRHGNGSDFDFLWSRMLTTNVANEARTIMELLGCTSDEEKMRQYLLSVLEKDGPIRYQDLTSPLSSVLSDPSHVEVVIANLNCSQWSKVYPSMESVLNTVASALHTNSAMEKFETLLSSNECDAAAVESARTTLSKVKASIAWAEDHKKDVLNKVKNNAMKSLISYSLIALPIISMILSY